jgi:hypothetical protein
VDLDPSEAIIERTQASLRISSATGRRLPLFKTLLYPLALVPREPSVVKRLREQGFTVDF